MIQRGRSSSGFQDALSVGGEHGNLSVHLHVQGVHGRGQGALYVRQYRGRQTSGGPGGRAPCLRLLEDEVQRQSTGHLLFEGMVALTVRTIREKRRKLVKKI